MRRVRAVALVLVALACAGDAWADDVRPVSLEIREVAPARFDVRFQTPMRGGRALKARPRLPAGSALVDGTYDRQVAGDSSIERFTFERAEGLVGQDVGVDGLVTASRNAVLRIRLRDGRDLRAVLGPARPVYRVEAAAAETRSPWTEAPARAARAGLLHGLLEPAHLLLALALVLAAPAGTWILALALFLLFGAGGALLGPCLQSGLLPTAALADALTALVACLVAREALLGRSRRLLVLAACAGLLHGLAPTPLGSGALVAVGTVLGLDLAHLAIGAVGVLLLSVLRRPVRRRAGAWAVGILAVAVAGVAAALPDAVRPRVSDAGLLPAALAADADPSRAQATPAQGLVTDLEAYLDVGVFDTRLEILGRLWTLEGWFGTERASNFMLGAEAQPALLERISASILERLTIRVDGREVVPDSVRSGFAVQEPTGTYIRDEPVDEPESTALVGVVYALGLPRIPGAVEVTWSSLPPDLAEMRVRVIDPEVSREMRLPADAPRLAWENTLREDPLPSVSTVRVLQQPVPLPLLTLGLLAFALVGCRFVLRRRTSALAGACRRLSLALAFLVLPILTVDISAWTTRREPPTAREARMIASALLDNVYRAFNVPEEEAVYDRLALSLTETSRTAAYMENRRALAIARVGGARTHVEVVELRTLDDVRPTSDGGFEADAAWTVAGSVTHFGHRHLRQNLYRARLAVTPVDGAWKIETFAIEDLTRER